MYAYETAVVVIQALDQVAAKDRTAILETCLRPKDSWASSAAPGASPRTGDTDSSIIGLNQVQNGAIVYLEADLRRLGRRKLREEGQLAGPPPFE